MLNILIIDDELPARKRLQRMLSTISGVHISGEAANGQEALQMLSNSEPDVLLLDISMPGIDGMALAQMLHEQDRSPAVIFCTAWSDQAVDAFACEAVDYLVKPIRVERLQTALDKASRFIAESGQVSESFLRSTMAGQVSLLPLADVIFLMAEDKYTIAVHEQGRLVLNQSLRELENRYADIFVRAGRSVLVKKNRIRGLEKATVGRHYLVLEGTDEQPPVSRRNLPAIRKLIREIT